MSHFVQEYATSTHPRKRGRIDVDGSFSLIARRLVREPHRVAWQAALPIASVVVLEQSLQLDCLFSPLEGVYGLLLRHFRAPQCRLAGIVCFGLFQR